MLAFVFGVLLLLYGTSCGFHAYENVEPDLVLRSESPSALYVVQLIGNGDRPTVGTNRVDLEVLKNGKLYFNNEYFHSGDSFDVSFKTGYPEHQWVSKNIVRFYRPRDLEGGRSSVRIFNRATTDIMFMKLFCTDKFVLLDLDPKSMNELECSMAMGDTVSLFVEGQFKNGRRFESGTSFPSGKEGNAYTIEVFDEKVRIIKQGVAVG